MATKRQAPPSALTRKRKSRSNGAEDGVDKLIKFLNTENGHQIAEKAMGGFGKYFHRSALHDLLYKTFQVGVVLVVILVIYNLADNQRMDPSIGVLLGTLVGYMFAKKD